MTTEPQLPKRCVVFLCCARMYLDVSSYKMLCLSSSDAQRHQLFQEVCNSRWHAVIKGSSRFVAHIPQEWESEVSAPVPSVPWVRFEDLRTISRIINNVMLNKKNTNKTLFLAGALLQHLYATSCAGSNFKVWILSNLLQSRLMTHQTFYHIEWLQLRRVFCASSASPRPGVAFSWCG